ncbi:MAG TPA: hypothetical protein ENK43_03195 [Planctomycetes bacterium]|nr:hypothetical protein [Planctomycetota bacterium]
MTSIRAFPILLALCALAPTGLAQEALRFEVKIDPDYSRLPKTGDLYLIISEEAVGEPRMRLDEYPMRGFVFKTPVRDLKPGEPVIIDARTPGYPGPLGELLPGRYAVQAVLDVSPTTSDFTRAAGNGRSRPIRPFLDPKSSGSITVTIDREITVPRPRDIGRIRYRTIELRSLGHAIGHRFFVKVAVVLPHSWNPRKEQTYPVQYWIPGLGERVHGALGFFQGRGVYGPTRRADGTREQEFIYVLVGSMGRHGHLGWVDSENNGPALKAFVEELIPAVEAEFPVAGEPEDRYLVGHGMGGLSALWLLASRPGLFAGAWALAPDPVDFHDFFGVDLYARPPRNAYLDADGKERPLIVEKGRPVVTWREEARFESIVGTGNLLQSYEAILSPKGPGGAPRPLFHRGTGRIDPATAEFWTRRDLHRMLAQVWKEQGPELDGKIHIWVGDKDNFGLHRPVARLWDALESWNAEAEVKVLPGKNHADLDAAEIHRKVQREIAADYEDR